MIIKNAIVADISFVEGTAILPLSKIPVFKQFGTENYIGTESPIGTADNFRLSKDFIICDIELFDKTLNPLALQVTCSVKIDNETKEWSIDYLAFTTNHSHSTVPKIRIGQIINQKWAN